MSTVEDTVSMVEGRLARKYLAARVLHDHPVLPEDGEHMLLAMRWSDHIRGSDTVQDLRHLIVGEKTRGTRMIVHQDTRADHDYPIHGSLVQIPGQESEKTIMDLRRAI